MNNHDSRSVVLNSKTVINTNLCICKHDKCSASIHHMCIMGLYLGIEQNKNRESIILRISRHVWPIYQPMPPFYIFLYFDRIIIRIPYLYVYLRTHSIACAVNRETGIKPQVGSSEQNSQQLFTFRFSDQFA